MENPGSTNPTNQTRPSGPSRPQGGFDASRWRLLIGLSLVLALVIVWPLSACANEVFLSADEQRFLDAEQALKKGDLAAYQKISAQMRDKTLLPYLEFQRVSRDLSNTSAVEAFRDQYAGSYLEHRLYQRWVRWLGGNRRWRQFRAVWRGDGGEALKCYGARADLAEEGATAAVLEEAKSLWLKGGSVDDACDPLFQRLEKLGVITPTLRWRRIELAMDAGKVSLARYLAKKLTGRDKKDFTRYLKTHRQPEAMLKKAVKWKDTPRNRKIIAHGVKRYSREDTVDAWHRWHRQFKQHFNFSDELIIDVENRLILRAAWRHLPEAFDWFQIMPGELLNDEAREWRVRTALRAQDWALARDWIDALPPAKQREEQWRYWRARADEALGETEKARQAFEKLATDTSYYGFLAADHMGLPYTFTNEPVIDEAALEKVNKLAALPAFRRVKALYSLGREGTAYAEWRFEIDKMSTAQKRVAARLAHDWGWHFTAIVTTAQANHYADLDLRFPLLYRDNIQRESRRLKIRPSLIYGVMRRESAFREAAVSPAGALGLMQIMPATARMMTRKLGMKRVSRRDLKKANTNILLGASYLREVLDKYQNNEILATASYNAGPQSVRKWLPEEAPLPADIWVDTITFDETRKYVKAVHFYSTIFDWKTDGRVDVRLKDRMTPVAPETGGASSTMARR